MKRFKWKLQRVLDIKAQHERALKNDLFALAQVIVQVREEMLRRQTVVRTLLEELERRSLLDRLADQVLFMEFSVREERLIQALRQRLRDLEAERARKQEAYLQVRAMIKTLNRLRAEARTAYLRDVGKREQREFDESAHIAFARRAAARTAAVA